MSVKKGAGKTGEGGSIYSALGLKEKEKERKGRRKREAECRENVPTKGALADMNL